MTVGELDEASKLIVKLGEAIHEQNKILDSLRESLNEYVEFLQKQIKRLRDE